MDSNNQPTANTTAGTTTTHTAPMSSAQRSSLPLMLISFLAVGSAAYFLGRGTASPSRATPTSTAAAPADERAGEGKEGRGGEGEHTEGGPITLSPAAEKAAGIRTAPVGYAAFGESLTVPGTVEVSPNRAARVTPPVGGKILALFAAPGDRVAAGQRLAVLDSPEVAQGHAAVREAQARVTDAQAQVQTAQAGVVQAQTRLSSAQVALRRQREFARTGALSQPSLQAAQNELNTAQSELAQAQTDLQAQNVIVARNQRLFDAQIVAKAELEQSQVAQTQAGTRVQQAEKRVALARQALEREQRVFRSGLLNRQAIQTAEAEVRAAEGDVRQARKQEQAARTSLEGARSGLVATQANLRALEGNGHSEGGAGRISLYAPLGGTIAARGATTGQAVERSSELFTIQNLESVIVEANVPEASVARVRIGAPVTVTVAAYPKARFAGAVQSVGSQVDPKTRALPVRCLVQNRNSALKPEMFARVSLAAGNRTNSSRVLVVPDEAVGEDGGESIVFVKTGSGTFERREITVGRTSNGSVEVVAGLKPGESIVTEGVFALKSETKKGELSGDDD